MFTRTLMKNWRTKKLITTLLIFLKKNLVLGTIISFMVAIKKKKNYLQYNYFTTLKLILTFLYKLFLSIIICMNKFVELYTLFLVLFN